MLITKIEVIKNTLCFQTTGVGQTLSNTAFLSKHSFIQGQCFETCALTKDTPILWYPVQLFNLYTHVPVVRCTNFMNHSVPWPVGKTSSSCRRLTCMHAWPLFCFYMHWMVRIETIPVRLRCVYYATNAHVWSEYWKLACDKTMNPLDLIVGIS